MNLVLTAAGRYERFRRFSYEIPKYLLPVKNRTMLHHVLAGFGGMDTTFVGNKRDIRFAGIIRSILEEMCCKWTIKWIDDTSGQAQTLLQATEDLDSNILVHNIDTVLLNRIWNWVDTDTECVIDVFESSNRDYSYVIDEDGYASEIREKDVISNKASSGCYWFKDRSFIEKHVHKDTEYISEVVNDIIRSGVQNVRTTRLFRASDTVVMGTPEEYIVNMDSEKLGVS